MQLDNELYKKCEPAVKYYCEQNLKTFSNSRSEEKGIVLVGLDIILDEKNKPV